jgi:hypothetical protein
MNQEIKPLHVLTKGLLLFIIFNLFIAAWQPRVGRFSLYNAIFPDGNGFRSEKIPRRRTT